MKLRIPPFLSVACCIAEILLFIRLACIELETSLSGGRLKHLMRSL